MRFSEAWIHDPEIFAVNRLPACSDHELFRTEEEAEIGVSSLVMSLNGVWRAHFALTPAEAPDALITDSAMDRDLMSVTVPCEFQLVNPAWNPPHYVNTMYPWDGREDLLPPQVQQEQNPTVTAVRSFMLDEAELDCGRIVLTFGAVEAAVAVWMNGDFIGYAEDSFTPHRFDVTASVHAGENRLVARVFKRCTGSWLEDQDFWRFSGIHRDVTLTFEPKTHLADVFVHTPLNDDFTSAKVSAELKIDHPQGAQITMKLTAPDGTEAGTATGEAKEHLFLTIPVEAPMLWSAETPDLYTMSLIVTRDGAVQEVGRLEVGIRSFAKKDGVYCLNGKRLIFRGVNRHEFDCDTGRVMSLDKILRDLREIKAMNMNAIRTCHYPNDSAFYRLCDRYGLYVIDETNIESHGTWQKLDGENSETAIPGDRPEWFAAVLDRGASMLERDKNHACVLMWSCGNESFGGENLFALSEYFRGRDSSRAVHYEGVFHDRRYNNTSDFESRMYAKVADIEEYLNNNPEKPFINCEYTHAMGNSCGGMHLYRELEDKYPLYQGGFIWDYMDQALRTTAPNGQERLAYGGDFGDRPTDYQFNTNGILLGDHTHTGKVQEVHHVFQPVDVSPAADHVTIRNRRLFTNLNDCLLDCELLLDGAVHEQISLELPEISPDATVDVPLAFDLPQEDGEVILVCRLRLKEEASLLPAGYVVADGWTCLRAASPAAPKQPARLIHGDYNYGARGEEGLAAIFGRKYRGLISLKDRAGKEMVLCAPTLSLFRAPTDNDMGNGYDIAEGVWHAFSVHAAVSEPKLSAADGAPALTYTYTSPVVPGLEIKLTYVCRADGLEVTVDYPGAKDLPDLPALGLSFRLDPSLDRVEFYGFGPDESYMDRCTGAMPGIWHYAVSEGWTRYCKPQESGSRYGVRRFDLTASDGHGLRIEAIDQPLEISASPWMPEELMCARHPDELVGSCRTVLDVALFRRGIAGDDSWGAPPLPQYTQSAANAYQLKFFIKAL